MFSLHTNGAHMLLNIHAPIMKTLYIYIDIWNFAKILRFSLKKPQNTECYIGLFRTNLNLESAVQISIVLNTLSLLCRTFQTICFLILFVFPDFLHLFQKC